MATTTWGIFSSEAMMECRRVCSDDAVAGIDQDDDQVGIGGAGYHIAGILDMTGCIGDDELALGCRKIFVSDIDGNALFAFGAQAIGQQGQIDLSVFLIPALSFERFQLVGQDALAVDTADGRSGCFSRRPRCLLL